MPIQAIEAYFAALENPNAIDYYSDVMEVMSCLVWDAMNAKRNVALGNMGLPVFSTGPTGLHLMSPGS